MKIVHTPHRPLTDYYANEEQRRGFLRKIFDNTAADYDRVDRLLALGSGPWYRRQALMRAGGIEAWHARPGCGWNGRCEM